MDVLNLVSSFVKFELYNYLDIVFSVFLRIFFIWKLFDFLRRDDYMLLINFIFRKDFIKRGLFIK